MTCPRGHDAREITDTGGRRVCRACQAEFTNRANASRRRLTETIIRDRRARRGETPQGSNNHDRRSR